MKKIFYFKLCYFAIILINRVSLLLNQHLSDNFKEKWLIRLFRWRLLFELNKWTKINIKNNINKNLLLLNEARFDLIKYNKINYEIGLGNNLVKSLIGRIQKNKINEIKEDKINGYFCDEFFSSLGHFYYAFGYLYLVISKRVITKKIYFDVTKKTINKYLYAELIQYAINNNIFTKDKNNVRIELDYWYSNNNIIFEPNEMLKNLSISIISELNLQNNHKEYLLYKKLALNPNKKIVIIDIRNSGYNDKKFLNFSLRNQTYIEKKKIIHFIENYVDKFHIIDISNHKLKSKLKNINKFKYNIDEFEYITYNLFMCAHAIIGSISGPLIISKLFGKQILALSNIGSYDLPFNLKSNEFLNSNFLQIRETDFSINDILIDSSNLDEFSLFNIGFLKKDVDNFDKLLKFLEEL